MKEELKEMLVIVESLVDIVKNIDDRLRDIEDKTAESDFNISQGEVREINSLRDRIEGFKDNLF